MERMINDRLVWYLESNGLISNLQCGFRSKRCTTDHLDRLETVIREAFIRNEHLAAIFFDLEKAYDTMSKYGMMRDLHDLGLKGRLPHFICGFISDCKFKVRIGFTLSNMKNQEEGVSQGSVLSVSLFSIKISNITKCLTPRVDGSLYVDDLLICYRSKYIHAIECKLQKGLDKLNKRATENDENARSLLKLERQKEGKERRKKKALILTRTSLNIIGKLICKIYCSSIPTQAISAIMAFNPKLIPLFDGTDSGQLVVEWVEKAELVCRLSGVKNIECVVPMRLSGGAYAFYQQLSKEKRANFACIKDVLYTAFTLNPMMAFKQFAVCHLRPGETVDILEVRRSRVWSVSSLLSCRSMWRNFFRPLPG